MKNIFIIILLIFTVSNYALAETVKIWPDHKLFGSGINSIKAPSGFTVTPAEVNKMYKPQKYVVEIYVDDYFYYITKSGATPQIAEEYGIKINGETGSVIYPKAINKYSVQCKLRGYTKIKQK
jgi:hypothetical protein